MGFLQYNRRTAVLPPSPASANAF
uniref:Uncharacterized protein n=1 Tax=Anguilla anguilla TaxID=7936 RepID=A0A0E9V971_ANGAN